MTPKQLHAAAWVNDIPPTEYEEIMAPWTTLETKRVLQAVESEGEVYMIARDIDTDEIMECWRVLR